MLERQRRTISDSGGSSDSGAASDSGAEDPRLVEALAAHHGDAGRLPDVLAALHRVRVVAPVLALRGDAAGPTDRVRVDSAADIVLPVLVGAEGSRAVPVFSGLTTMARWDPAARPVPVTGRRAAAVAVAEQAEALVIDIAGPHPVTLLMPELSALGDGKGVVPAYDDDGLHHAVQLALAGLPEVVEAWLGPWAGADGRLTVRLARDAEPADVAPRLVSALRAVVRESVVHGLDVAVAAAGTPDPPARQLFPAVS